MTPFYHVFKLPKDFPSEYCFGGGIPVTITMVDWFGSPEKVSEDKLIQFILKKKYASGGRLLVIERHTNQSFIIEIQDNRND